MNKKELKNKIQQIYKDKFAKKIDLSNPSPISLDMTRFPILVKFPKMKSVIVDLLTTQYDLFLKDIQWVAPRPTTFRVILANDKPFYLIYTDKSWIAKIEGKKYYLLNVIDEENACEALSRILSYGSPDVTKEETDKPTDEKPEGEAPEVEDKPLPKEEEPEPLKEIEGEQVELSKSTLMDLLGPEKIAKLKNFGANKKSWISIYEKIAKKMGITIDKFYEDNLEDKVRDIITK